MSKVFLSIGVSRYPNGEVHIHYTNDSAQRIKAYSRGNNTDIHFWDLPQAMSKLDACKHLEASGAFADKPADLRAAFLQELTAQTDKAQGASATKAPKVAKAATPKKAPRTSKKADKEAQQKQSLDAIQEALHSLAAKSEAEASSSEDGIDLAELEALASS